MRNIKEKESLNTKKELNKVKKFFFKIPSKVVGKIKNNWKHMTFKNIKLLLLFFTL